MLVTLIGSRLMTLARSNPAPAEWMDGCLDNFTKDAELGFCSWNEGYLPHYEITEKDSKAIHVLARQPIDPDRPHPFTTAGNAEFNCLLWMPSNRERAGDIVLVDSTNFTTLFGGTESLQNFWRNFALI